MAITTSRAGVLTDALVAAFQNSAALASPVEVFDGPVTGANTMWTQAVFVGFNGDWHTDNKGDVAPGTPYPSVDIDWSDYRVGNTSVTENLQIFCCAAAWSGDPNVQVNRNLALAILAACTVVVRTDPTVGVDGSTITKMTVGSAHVMFDSQGNSGYQIPFTVHVETYLSTV